jgi:hypothetical protein
MQRGAWQIGRSAGGGTVWYTKSSSAAHLARPPASQTAGAMLASTSQVRTHLLHHALAAAYSQPHLCGSRQPAAVVLAAHITRVYLRGTVQALIIRE